MTLDRDTVVVRLGIMNDLLGGVDAERLRSDRSDLHDRPRVSVSRPLSRPPMSAMPRKHSRSGAGHPHSRTSNLTQ